MQQPEEPAAKPKTQGHGTLRLVKKRGVVQAQLLERIAQPFVIACFHRIKPGKDHGLDLFESHERLRRRPRVVRDGVADASVGNALDVRDDVADFARLKPFDAHQLRRADAEFLDRVNLKVRTKADFRPHGERPLNYPREDNDTSEAVEPGIEDVRLEWRFGRSLGRRNARHNRLHDFFDARALLGADLQGFAGVNRQGVLDLLFGSRHVGARQINLVDDRNDG